MQQEPFKVIIAGGRDFNNYKMLYDRCQFFLQNKENIEVVSGGAKGADTLGERYAKENGHTVKRFIPDWSIGRVAGILRNAEMAEYADALIAFWDGKSKGTKNMIDTAKKLGLKVRVENYWMFPK